MVESNPIAWYGNSTRPQDSRSRLNKGQELFDGLANLNGQKILQRMWRGALGSLVLYLLIPFLVSAGRHPDSPGQDRLRLILWGLSIVNVAILWWCRDRYVDRELPAEGQMLPMVRNLTNKGIAISLAGSIAVYGLALALLRGYLIDQYLLTSLSALWLWYFRPSSSPDS